MAKQPADVRRHPDPGGADPMDAAPNNQSLRIWQATLGQLQLQMTKATFDTWFTQTRLLDVADHTFTIGVPNEYAKDWLENRLNGVIERTLGDIIGHPTQVQFVIDAPVCPPVEAPPETDLPAEPLPALASPPIVSDQLLFSTVPDPTRKYAAGGYVPILHYTARYWAAYWQKIRRRAAAEVWVAIRDLAWWDDKKPWTPAITLNASRIARMKPVGRQVVSGVWRYNGTVYYPGSVDILRITGFAVTRRETDDKGHASRKISVLRHLPPLTPWQADFLTPGDRKEHRDFLERALKLDLDEWQAITARSLVPALRERYDPPPFDDDGQNLEAAFKFWPFLEAHKAGN